MYHDRTQQGTTTHSTNRNITIISRSNIYNYDSSN